MSRRLTPEERRQIPALLERGLTRGQVAVKLRCTKATVRRWGDPAFRAEANRKALAHRRRHRARLNREARLYQRERMLGTCPTCGAEVKRADTRQCRRCHDEDRRFLWAELAELTRKGYTAAQMAEQTGRTLASVQGHLARGRRAGEIPPGSKVVAAHRRARLPHSPAS